MAGRAARKLFAPAALIGAALACFLVIEVVSRLVLVLSHGSPAAEYHQFGYDREPLQGFELMPGLRDEHFDKLKTSISTNSRGLRGRAEYGEKPPDTIRGAVIGGSCAFGYGASSDRTTISGQLEDQFSNLEVLNAGVPGYVSFQVLSKLQLKLIDLDLDFVVLYMGWNDFLFAAFSSPFHRNTFFGRDRYFAFDSWQTFIEMRNKALVPAFLRPFAAGIYLGRLQEAIASLGAKPDSGSSSPAEEGHLIESPDIRAAAESQLRDNLLSIIGMLRQREVKIVFVSLFADDEFYPKTREEINRILHDLANDTGSAWVDAAAVAEERALKGLNQESDHYHLTDEGNRLVANLAAERLATLFPNTKPRQSGR